MKGELQSPALDKRIDGAGSYRDLWSGGWRRSRSFSRARFQPHRQVRDLDGAQGRCCREDRTIRIAYLPGGEQGIVLLVHEIAHAVAGDGHGRKWQARMEKAAATAGQAGRTELAGLLRKEIAGYEDVRTGAGPGFWHSSSGERAVIQV